MDYKKEYERWLSQANNEEIKTELEIMTEIQIEEAFYCDLAFGTGGLRGIIGAGRNRMNIYTVGKASQGIANYLGAGASVVIGYDSRIKSDVFAKVAGSVFAANGIIVYIWPEELPVSTVSYAVRSLGASAGVMITASHNMSKYNGYKVYRSDGCQITTKEAEAIMSEIERLDIFADVKNIEFDYAVSEGKIKYIEDIVLANFIEDVKKQSVLFGDDVDRDIVIVYSPLNGTGLRPVTRVLREEGFTNITVVKEQESPDGNFTTCPYPNPEVYEAMELGIEYGKRKNADIFLATDPDCDRCGIAIKSQSGDYKLLSGNEVGLLLLDFICSQRVCHNKMPDYPVFVKTIVTMDLAEKIAEYYGVRTVNVLTGFKFIGEFIGKMEDVRNYICGFEESYGYLTGSYVRDKDAVGAVFMICEMYGFYKTRGANLLDKLEEIYSTYGYCINTLHSYEFESVAGIMKMQSIMLYFRKGLETVGGENVIKVEDYSIGLNGLPPSDALKFFIENGSIVIRPSGTEPKLKIYISVTADNEDEAKKREQKIHELIKIRLFEQ